MGIASRHEITRPYFPHDVAVAEGILNPSEAQAQPIHSAIENLRSGYMPDSKVGLVKLPVGVGAIDLVYVEYLTEEELVVLPGDKGQVLRDGRFNGIGNLLLSLPGGVRLIGETESADRHQWRRREVRSNRTQLSSRLDSVESNNFIYVPKSFTESHATPFQLHRIEDDGTMICRK